MLMHFAERWIRNRAAKFREQAAGIVGGAQEGCLLGLLLVLVIAASGRGGEFLDLHRTLPDRAFRDSRDHINFRDSADPTARMAKPMLDLLLRRGRSVDLPSDPS